MGKILWSVDFEEIPAKTGFDTKPGDGLWEKRESR